MFERGREDRDPLYLNSILRECIASTKEEYPNVRIVSDLESDNFAVDSLFNVVCSNIIQNAAQHNTNPDPLVAISVEQNGEYVQIRVEDNGPGIDQNELALIEQGTETPLEHGSGFGLALAVWGTDIAGGTVDFDPNDPTGTVVTLRAPILSHD